MSKRSPTRLLLAAVFCIAGALPAHAGNVRVAVASNFLLPMRGLAPLFEAETGHTATISSGSTGKLYAQIKHGAPFDVFLAANAREPERLENEGETVAGSRFTYALGRLTIWSARADVDALADLKAGRFSRIAIANPRLAPYGARAQEVFAALGIEETTTPALITAENVSQAMQFAMTGNADFGAVALSQVKALDEQDHGSSWTPGPELYTPIRQQSVLLIAGADNDAARAFVDFLKSDAARAAIENFGYGLE